MPRRTRQERYPDTATFHCHNENPNGRITTDCVIRAIATASEKEYKDVLMEMTALQIETGLDKSDPKAIAKYLEIHGWKKHKQPRKRDNTKYKGYNFCRRIQNPESVYHKYADKNIIANIGGHHIVAICNGKVYDHWNSTGGCIGNYWSR